VPLAVAPGTTIPAMPAITMSSAASTITPGCASAGTLAATGQPGGC
jgi:hypothetical protein